MKQQSFDVVMDIYEPAEDSYLLQKYVKEYAWGRVLDVGTGSGIQALSALRKPEVRDIVALDINPEAVQHLQQTVQQQRLRKLEVLQSDLFENVQGAFNTIIFNPPYLPQDKGIKDASIYGGEKGWETAERFFKGVSAHLFPDGLVLFLFSSLTNKEKIDTLLKNNLLAGEELGQEKLAFEVLYVYKITKTRLLLDLERHGIHGVYYFTHGKRGRIYKGTFDRQKLVKTHFPKGKPFTVAIKVQHEESTAIERIANEAKWLQRLNKEGIGPLFQLAGAGFVVYEFVEGEFIEEWIQRQEQGNVILTLLREVVRQCRVMDMLRVTKEEMHHPLKHVLVTPENRPVLLDFERCHDTLAPKNVTQFVEAICRWKEELQRKKVIIPVEALRNATAKYKESYDPKAFQQLWALLA